MKTVAKAKAQLSELVDLAIQGKSTTITRHKKPVARLIPVQPDSRRLTQEWRRRVAGVCLNCKGQPKRTISQLIRRAQ